LGKLQFITAYLLTGITASIISLWWHDNAISAGASGSIFGLYGIFLAMLTTNLVEKTIRKPMLSSVAIFVVYNLLFGLLGNIDNAGHIGGLIGGIIIGYAFVPGLKRPENIKLKFITIAVVTAIILVATFIIYKKIAGDSNAAWLLQGLFPAVT
jgi:rhomboid protease GluP